MSPRLLKFFDALAAGEFYGQVVVRFRKGQIAGSIKVEQEFLEETLPEQLPPPVPAPTAPIPPTERRAKARWGPN